MEVNKAKALERRVWDLMGKNDMKQAITACETLNLDYPEFAPGWHAASHLALNLNNAPVALAVIDNALSIEPDKTPWLLQKGLVLAKLGRLDELKPVVTALSNRRFATAYQCSTLAMLLTQLGRREKAINFYEQAAALMPNEPKHFYNIACLQRSLGDISASEKNFDETVRLNPQDFEAYKIRAELRKQTFDNNHVEQLEGLYDQGIDDQRGKVNVCYALAKELEDLGEWERSFHYLKTGADCRRSYMKYDAERELEMIRSIQRAYSAELFDGSIKGHDNTEAIFILGLPRTGTTLVERILSSHTDVFAAGELTNFGAEMMALVKAQATDAIKGRAELAKITTTLDFAILGEAYIDSTRPVTGNAPRFIDKLPLNYLYAGLIHLALPNAKIINLQRNPMDTCYAIYKQLFIDAYPFSYKLDELANYYVAYRQLMQHWNSELPGIVHTVVYEDLVADLEGESRRMTDFCGLEWQAECLKFYEKKEASTTASTVQVRQPVYQSSVGKWRNYEKQLQPVVDILTTAGIAVSGE